MEAEQTRCLRASRSRPRAVVAKMSSVPDTTKSLQTAIPTSRRVQDSKTRVETAGQTSFRLPRSPKCEEAGREEWKVECRGRRAWAEHPSRSSLGSRRLRPRDLRVLPNCANAI